MHLYIYIKNEIRSEHKYSNKCYALSYKREQIRKKKNNVKRRVKRFIYALLFHINKHS